MPENSENPEDESGSEIKPAEDKTQAPSGCQVVADIWRERVEGLPGDE